MIARQNKSNAVWAATFLVLNISWVHTMQNVESELLCCGNEHSYILRTSPGNGVGVFALHDIPAGTPLSDHMQFKVRMCKLADIPTELHGHCIHLGNGNAIAPQRFDHMSIFWYINHSATPNIGYRNRISIVDGQWLIAEMYATRGIKAGEELFCDYNELGEPEECKEDYYRPKL